MEEIRKEVTEKVILVAVADGDMREAEESLDELEELAKSYNRSLACFTMLRQFRYGHLYGFRRMTDQVICYFLLCII